MTHTVQCAKLQETAPALPHPPLPGPLGVRILNEISAPAWQMWLKHQTMLINEYRLNLTDKKARDFLTTELEKFLFEGESDLPPDFVPED